MENPFKKILLTATLATGLSVSAQELPQKTNGTHLNKPVPEMQMTSESKADSIPNNQDVLAAYEKNKIGNDEFFSIDGSLNTMEEAAAIIPKGYLVTFELRGPEKFTVKVKQRDENGTVISREVFTDFDSLRLKYPAYLVLFEKAKTQAYANHITNMGWKDILAEKEKTLSNDFSNYKPSEEELEIMRGCVKDSKEGLPNDGYDRIHNYYMDSIKTYADTYKFYEIYNGTPEKLAEYMKDTYFEPFIR